MTRCPTCSQPIRRTTLAPIDAVVTGAAGAEVAPILHAAWRAVQVLTEHEPGIAQGDLAHRLATAGVARPKTVENVCRAAVNAGQLRRVHLLGGTPTRRRAYLYPRPEVTP